MAGDRGENFLTIYSNDGNTRLVNNADCGDDISTLQVTTEGIVSDQKGIVYTYSGSGIYKGVATYPNATAATYPVGTTFTFGNATPNASVNEYLTLYIVEEEKPKATKTFDLSTLNLSAGTHEITVKARASGYEDSPASNAVSYVVGAGSGGATCFVAGTPVLMADGSTKAIENIVVGDEVLTWNEATKTYDTGVVIRLIRSETTDMAKVTFADGTSIEMTAMHPIYTQDGWKSLTGYNDLSILQVGDMALSVNGEYDEIVSIERWTAEKAVKVYNINVEDEHNYFAGETLILVHNKGSA